MIKTKQLNNKDLTLLKPEDIILIRYTNELVYLLEVIRMDDKYIICKTPNMKCIQETYLNKDGSYNEYVDDILQIL